MLLNLLILAWTQEPDVSRLINGEKEILCSSLVGANQVISGSLSLPDVMTPSGNQSDLSILSRDDVLTNQESGHTSGRMFC